MPPPDQTRPPAILPGRIGALALGLLVAWLAWLAFPAWFAATDARLADAFWRLEARSSPAAQRIEQRIVVVDIDEASLAALGPWPWPRQRLTELSTALASQGAAAQVFDIVLSDPAPGDDDLAAALRRNRGVLAGVFAVEQGAAIRIGDPAAAAVAAPVCADPIPAAHGWLVPAAPYAGLPLGHITPRIAADGIVRAQPAYICAAGRSHPALALATYLALAGHDTAPRWQAGSGLKPAWRLELAGGLPAIPLDARGDLRIPYRLAPRDIVAVSAADLLAGHLPPGQLAGSLVIVGSTAFGLGDIVATPHAGAQGGVGVHVQLLAGLLDDRLPHEPHAAPLLQAAAALAGALLLLLLAACRRLPGFAVPLIGIALAGGLIAAQAQAQAHDLLVGATWPALAVMLAGLALGLLEYLRTGGERTRLLAHLASYLPAPVATRLLAHRPEDRITAERREVSVLFADIRNFSAWCEAYDPETAAGVLHRFLVAADDIVRAHGGLVETVQGDAVMAVWNGSSPCAHHAEQALAAARALRRRIEAELPLSANPDESTLPPPLAIGIGIESGSALVGSVGPRGRRVHTVLGVAVTRAARLQALTADLAWPILVGPELHARVSDPALIPQGAFLLEGLVQPCIIHADK